MILIVCNGASRFDKVRAVTLFALGSAHRLDIVYAVMFDRPDGLS
jgi:hypothetical protein